MSKKYLFKPSALIAALVVLAVSGFSQTSPSKSFNNIKIKNFGQMDERFFRGAQPKSGEYQALKDLGINTVIDLQDEPADYEKAEVEALGMRYVNIPIKDKAYPTQESIDQFLKTIEDPATGVFFAHCAGGRHRTGDIGAVYRFTKYGWGYDQTYQEMKNYDFYSSWGHGKQKDFVEDYAAKMTTAKVIGAPAATATVTATSVNKN